MPFVDPFYCLMVCVMLIVNSACFEKTQCSYPMGELSFSPHQLWLGMGWLLQRSGWQIGSRATGIKMSSSLYTLCM